jgi:[FeFe] hydrogenase (group B1/B3)
MNCPKNAIHFKSNGQAEIDHDVCISCGICHQSCPYHAIIYVPVPCEEACPVKAISKDEFGVEHIDESKCIYCGKCVNACPFGAIFEISQVFDILETIKNPSKKIVAMVAPAILSQFNTTLESLYGALKEIGFDDVIEVALGADETTRRESHELIEKLEEGQPFMTTSCCPSYIQLVKKHIPEMEKYVSTTLSPMRYTAEIAKEKYPDCKTVFIGPCIAKRKEAEYSENVDFVMTFEELGSILDGMEINLEQVAPFQIDKEAYLSSHGYGSTGGVTKAVVEHLGGPEVNALLLSNLNKKNIGLLRAYAKSGKCPNQFIEVMACENGCISGPVTRIDKATAAKVYTKELARMATERAKK